MTHVTLRYCQFAVRIAEISKAMVLYSNCLQPAGDFVFEDVLRLKPYVQ